MTGTTRRIGIEKIHVYPSTLTLPLDALYAARGRDTDELHKYLLVDERSVLPPWEDTVTLAANAAAPMLDDEDRASIGLLLVGTESSLDQEKPVSSWVHGLLGLPSHCRNLEVKHACYGATGAIQLACAWLASGLAGDRKALVVSADASLLGFNEAHESVMGCCACAVLLSASPRLVWYELEPTGVFAQDVTDVFRPTLRSEMGNSDTSIYSYMEALTATYSDYAARWPEPIDFHQHFAKHIYHVPFGGITWRAHRTLLTQFSNVAPADTRSHFECKVLPSLKYNRRISATYGASTFVALLGLCDTARDLASGDRIGVYAYGSGACAEFYGMRVADEFRAAALEAGLAELLDARRPLTVAEYECAERTKVAATGTADFTPDRDSFGDVFRTHYQGRGRLVLDRVCNHYRSYEWV